MSTESKGYRALIVDDSYLMRSRLEGILEDESDISTIEHAQDGCEALNLVKEKEFDIILLDIEMPNMDGMEFLRRSKMYTSAKIIVVSSTCASGSENSKKAVSLGAFDTVEKPKGIYSHAEIRNKVVSAFTKF